MDEIIIQFKGKVKEITTILNKLILTSFKV
jgi:hypothetical protein